MLQQLLRRLVFDVPQLNEYCKMPLKVNLSTVTEIQSTAQETCLVICDVLTIWGAENILNELDSFES